MLLKSLKLNNIRTYENETISFSDGSTLLAGDIGSGKSSVLLSIEFALFGLQKGEINGTDLLKHGAERAAVELCMDVNGKEIKIGRNLKRTKKGISQEVGFIEFDGRREDKSPNDLKAEVLQLLGYPQEYLTKNPIMFRYTVYTPQDDMKRILIANQQERLDIVRKIFDIDKYGRIRDNTSGIIMKELRAMKRECQVHFSDVEKKQEEIRYIQSQFVTHEEKIVKKRIEIDKLEKLLESKEKEFEEVSDKIRELNVLKQDLVKKNTLSDQKKLRIRSIERELLLLEKKIGELEYFLGKPLEKPDMTESQVIELHSKYFQETAKSISDINLLESEVKKLEKILNKGLCDFCGQTVHNMSEFSGKIAEKNKIISEERKNREAKERKINEIEDLRQKIRKYNEEIIRRKDQEKNLKESVEKKQILDKEKDLLDSEIMVLLRDITDLSSRASLLSNLEKEYSSIRNEISLTRSRKEFESKELTRAEQQIESMKNQITSIEAEIAEKEKSKEKFEKLSEILSWFESIFIPMTDTIEKHVLSTIQKEFNLFFQQWFDVLIPDQGIAVSVDETFSPIIEQGSYITEYQNLSGGEKTSVALAYRLALNKVINSMVEGIKTKDLIILDEPTDGFSTDQLDRVRDVLNELNLKQMIIVSHEPKVDTYVNNIIRFYKEDNVSRVLR